MSDTENNPLGLDAMPAESPQYDLTRITDQTQSITDATPAEELHNMIGVCADLRKALKECEDRAWLALEERVRQLGDLTIGHIRYYIGKETKVKCKSVRNAVEAVLKATGGDADKFTECLSANAFKPGATRDMFLAEGVGEFYTEVFEVVEEAELKTGKPKTGLKSVDTRFIK